MVSLNAVSLNTVSLNTVSLEIRPFRISEYKSTFKKSFKEVQKLSKTPRCDLNLEPKFLGFANCESPDRWESVERDSPSQLTKLEVPN